MSLNLTTPSMLIARLRALLPKSSWPDMLDSLDVEVIAHALSLHGHDTLEVVRAHLTA